ncbi:hypothetical protein ABVT39_012872 [Epinephelus coioides]
MVAPSGHGSKLFHVFHRDKPGGLQRYTLAEVLEILDADDPSAKITSISVVPESENNARETDCDSDFSDDDDDDVTCDPKRQPSRLLKGDCFVSDGDMQLPIIDDGQEPE